jgi:hypothetical protein
MCPPVPIQATHQLPETATPQALPQPRPLLNLRGITSRQTRRTINRNNTTSKPNQRASKHPPGPPQPPNRPPRNRPNIRQTKTPRHNRPRIPRLLQNRPQKRLPQLPRLPPPTQGPRPPSLHPNLTTTQTLPCTPQRPQHGQRPIPTGSSLGS